MGIHQEPRAATLGFDTNSAGPALCFPRLLPQYIFTESHVFQDLCGRFITSSWALQQLAMATNQMDAAFTPHPGLTCSVVFVGRPGSLLVADPGNGSSWWARWADLQDWGEWGVGNSREGELPRGRPPERCMVAVYPWWVFYFTHSTIPSRPCTAEEQVEGWHLWLGSHNSPLSLILGRMNSPVTMTINLAFPELFRLFHCHDYRAKVIL